MSKRTHKLRGLGDAASVVAASPTLSAAANALGVDRSTIWRWMQAGKVPAPSGPPAPKVTPETVAGGLSPDEWAARVRAERDLDATGSMLVDLGIEALKLARQRKHPILRLSAMTRFQAIAKQLRLDEAVEAEVEPEREVPEPVRVPRIRRVTHDPRHVLQAVK